jgi:regulator of RNase E activity RraB
VIDLLVRSHSDLRKPHSFDFYLYLPTKVAAASAAVQLSEQGYKSVVERGADGNNWLCLANKAIVPDKPRIHAAQEQMRMLAAKYGGNYDGWESDVNR